jgi:hypothetical protein
MEQFLLWGGGYGAVRSATCTVFLRKGDQGPERDRVSGLKEESEGTVSGLATVGATEQLQAEEVPMTRAIGAMSQITGRGRWVDEHSDPARTCGVMASVMSKGWRRNMPTKASSPASKTSEIDSLPTPKCGSGMSPFARSDVKTVVYRLWHFGI